MRNGRFALIGLGVAAALGLGVLGALSAIHLHGNRGLEAFYSRGSDPSDFVTEDMQMDPLILAGNDVVPVVIREVRKASMPKRRYAIGFLGNGGYREALPVLRQLLADPKESEIIRGDALEAIAQIDKREGQQLAQAWAQGDGFLGLTAREVLSGVEPKRRTYLEALLGCHDC